MAAPLSTIITERELQPGFFATVAFNSFANLRANTAPTATNLSAAESYVQGTPKSFAANAIVISDTSYNNQTFTATLTLSDKNAGTLNTATSGSVTSTFSVGADTSVWQASGPLSNVNALLAGLTFTPSGSYSSSFTIATSVSDGIAAPITGTKVVTGSANTAPTATNMSTADTFTIGTASALTAIVISDTTSTGQTITATLTLSVSTAGTINTATSNLVTSTFISGVWRASGALEDVNVLLGALTFTSSSYSGLLSIATSVSDGIAAAVTGTKTMTAALPVSGAILWLDATDSNVTPPTNNSAVSTWRDKSGGAKNATQGTSNRQPLWISNGINGSPAIRFDGIDDFLTNTSIGLGGTTLTAFVVANRVAIVNLTSTFVISETSQPHDYDNPGSFVAGFEQLGGILETGRVSGMSLISPHPGNNVPYIHTITFTGSNSISYLNGTAGSTIASSGTFNANRLLVGARWFNGALNTMFYNGRIGEIIVYNSLLNSTNRQKVHTYLSNKWGIPLTG